MHATNTLAEANRQITICNACRYCESLCAVFPAMEQRRVFTDDSLDYLANLCHNCGACYDACQYVPPHDFAVNVPKVLAEVRSESYARYAWPRGFAPLFHRNGVVVASTAAAAVALFISGFVALGDPTVLFATQTGPGAFYRLMPHEAMVLLFGGVFLFAMLALTMSVRTCWRAIGGGRLTVSDMRDAGRAAATLHYLHGGGGGCSNEEERSDDRRFFHHCTFYGFFLCFASTSLATVLHNGFGWQAPYPWYNPVVLLGIIGGLGLLVGPVGLLRAKEHRNPNLIDSRARGMEMGFLLMLLFTSATGMLLLLLRATPLMGVLLALHLGVVFALFLSFPYGKFVHGFYRYAALARFAQEKRLPTPVSDHP